MFFTRIKKYLLYRDTLKKAGTLGTPIKKVSIYAVLSRTR